MTGFEVFRTELRSEYPTHHPRLTTQTEKQIKNEIQNDIELQKLCDTITNGWPQTKDQLDKILFPYWPYRDELSVHNGLIYKGALVFIPPTMRKDMLQKIHINHFGAQSNIRMSRQVLFWPGMRHSIQDLCESCSICAKYSTTATKEPMRSLPIPTLPWQIVSQDLLEYETNAFLVTVCHYSDWIEVDKLKDTLSTTITECTSAQFARHGIPKICHTDNSPQFISSQYEKMLETYGVKHTTSSPYYPKGNGKAEAAVKICKNMLKKASDFNLALLNYRNTPPQGHSYSPAERMMNRRT